MDEIANRHLRGSAHTGEKSMFDVSRRRFVISAAAAGAAFGLDGPIEFIAPAHAQKQKTSAVAAAGTAARFKRFKVGDLEVTTIYDGVWEAALSPGFVTNATMDEIRAALRAGGLSDAQVPIPFTVTLVRIKDYYVLFDSGTGAQVAPTAGQFTANLKAAGIDPSRIRTIIVSHFHPDHIFGLMQKDTNAQVFPDAEILVGAAEYRHWTDPATTDFAAKRIQATFPNWKNMRHIEPGAEVAAGIRVIATYGHTPGHLSYSVSSGNRQLIVLGDVTNIPALFVRNPHWHVSFDADGVLAEASRRRIFDQAIADKAIVSGYHYGMPGAGVLAKDGKGYVYKPMA
jgi:glyoxylase-like metal-dependent hydrolase (beta-lactamase superfamily II)